MYRSQRHHFFVCLLAMALALTAGTAFAQNTVQVHLDVIVASNEGESIDAHLKDHAEQLRTQFDQFSHFETAHTEQVQLTQGKTHTVQLPGGETAEFTLQKVHNGQATIQIKVPGGQTTLNAKSGGMMFVGGPHAPDGIILLLIEVM